MGPLANATTLMFGSAQVMMNALVAEGLVARIVARLPDAMRFAAEYITIWEGADLITNQACCRLTVDIFATRVENDLFDEDTVRGRFSIVQWAPFADDLVQLIRVVKVIVEQLESVRFRVRTHEVYSAIRR